MSDDLKAKALESLSDTRNRLMVEVANVELPPDQREFLQNMFRDLHIYQVKLVAIDPGSLTTTARSRLQNLVDLLNRSSLRQSYLHRIGQYAGLASQSGSGARFARSVFCRHPRFR